MCCVNMKPTSLLLILATIFFSSTAAPAPSKELIAAKLTALGLGSLGAGLGLGGLGLGLAASSRPVVAVPVLPIAAAPLIPVRVRAAG